MDHIDALIVSHGQPSSPDPAEAALAAYVAQVQVHVPDLRLGSATLAKPGSLDALLERMAPGAVIYPLFMSDGWFVRTCLAGRVGDAPFAVMTPFGMDPDLPDLAASGLRAEGWADGDPLLLVAHGSGSGRPAPERATDDFAKALATALGGANISVGFLEQSPTIPEVAKGLPDNVLCLPFFAMEGDHVREDVHEELGECAFKGRVLPVISQLPGVDAMVARAIKAKLAEGSAAQQAASA
ncbi:CbiX/SirB N-terminal domain-containing protein [Aliiroseovarius sp. F47248L]|uniref:sirohydrochlorin chelatase n=1 Tax=Aliiroseovarius sp. F47248L TaxID=2926420 RepID=UPI001FF21285|nr:CbiX/SirB N-terminal domain-containing protein [Aliiroseovarius sp. F47248L]MCK0140487.1 cobalamin biosynthesis protein CbiX [Aliiroseovarius sp. F47248L]